MSVCRLLILLGSVFLELRRIFVLQIEYVIAVICYKQRIYDKEDACGDWSKKCQL